MARRGGRRNRYGMNSKTDSSNERRRALNWLSTLGLRGVEVRFAELYPAIETAWADGRLEAREQELLYRYADELTAALNAELGSPFFTTRRTRRVLNLMLGSRPDPAARACVLEAIETLVRSTARPEALRARLLHHVEAVAAAGGKTASAEERLWIETVKTAIAPPAESCC